MERFQYIIRRQEFCYSPLPPPPHPCQVIKVHIQTLVSSQNFTGGNGALLETMPLFNLRVHYSSSELHLTCTALLYNGSEISNAHALPLAWMMF